MLNVNLKADLLFVNVLEVIQEILILTVFAILVEQILVVPMLSVKITEMQLYVDVLQNMLVIPMFLAHLILVPSILVDRIQNVQ